MMTENLKNYDRIHWQVQPKLGATKQLSENLTGCNCGDLPQQIVDHVKVLLLDALACILMGSEKDACVKLLSFAVSQGGKQECKVAMCHFRTNRYMASLLNGSYCQASGLDAQTDEMLHCAGVVVASALAMSDMLISEGNRLIAAIALGWETMCRLHRAAVCVPDTRPLDPTSTFGPFGAAVVAAKLLGFSAFDMENALSLCPAQAAAPARAMLTQSEVGLLHAGFAASWGLRSAYLAKEGLSGPRHILEGNMAFFKCVSGFHDDDQTTRYNIDFVNERFGEQWFLENTKFVLSDGSVSEQIPDFSEIEKKFTAVCDKLLIDEKKRNLVICQIRNLENVNDCSAFLKLLNREEKSR